MQPTRDERARTEPARCLQHGQSGLLVQEREQAGARYGVEYGTGEGHTRSDTVSKGHRGRVLPLLLEAPRRMNDHNMSDT